MNYCSHAMKNKTNQKKKPSKATPRVRTTSADLLRHLWPLLFLELYRHFASLENSNRGEWRDSPAKIIKNKNKEYLIYQPDSSESSVECSSSLNTTAYFHWPSWHLTSIYGSSFSGIQTFTLTEGQGSNQGVIVQCALRNRSPAAVTNEHKKASVARKPM